MLLTIGVLLASAVLSIASAIEISSRCSAKNVELPHIPGTHLFNVNAHKVENYLTTATSAQSGVSLNATLNFCNITLNYGHQGWKDNVQVTVWLPLQNWNQRLSGIGGGGFASLDGFAAHASAVSRGYAAVGTNAGHIMDPGNATSWALDESSNVNLFLTQNFFAISQNEAAMIGKKVAQDMYGNGPRFSYWDGCSTGGRQGLMLAQRYPNAYDGILAGCPAINWANFVPGMYYPQFVMEQLKHFPVQCVFSAFFNATVEACDDLDGLKDGIISMPHRCDFNARSLVGQKVTCGSQSFNVSAEDAQVVQKIWDGPKNFDGTPIWYGMPKGVQFKDLANTTCEGDRCTGAPFGPAADWIRLFVLQNKDFDLLSLPADGFEAAAHLSVSAYKDISSTDNPDLADFRQAGGKLLHWHGTADQQIFSPGSENYYKRVEAKDPYLRDFYRYFEAPGVQHCGGGNGLVLDDPLSALVDWVERDIPPDALPATTVDGTQRRNLCPHPLVPAYQYGDATKPSSFICSHSYTRKSQLGLIYQKLRKQFDYFHSG